MFNNSKKKSKHLSKIIVKYLKIGKILEEFLIFFHVHYNFPKISCKKYISQKFEAVSNVLFIWPFQPRCSDKGRSK